MTVSGHDNSNYYTWSLFMKCTKFTMKFNQDYPKGIYAVKCTEI